MIFIGEKINGSIPSIAEAIAKRDADFIRERARVQTEAGADYIDVCASVEDAVEVETLKWLIECVQEATDLPICIDSPNPRSCVAAMQYCKRPGIINSVSGEGDKCDVVFPAIAGTEWQCVALLCAHGIPGSAEERLEVFRDIVAKADKYGVDVSKLHIDPMVEMLCTSEDGINMLVDVMHKIKKDQPTVHIVAAVSNISFNLPARRLINQAFVVLAINAGLDSAVLDPTNRDLTGMIYATEALLGMDDYCMEYIGAYRRNLFGTKK